MGAQFTPLKNKRPFQVQLLELEIGRHIASDCAPDLRWYKQSCQIKGVDSILLQSAIMYRYYDYEYDMIYVTLSFAFLFLIQLKTRRYHWL